MIFYYVEAHHPGETGDGVRVEIKNLEVEDNLNKTLTDVYHDLVKKVQQEAAYPENASRFFISHPMRDYVEARVIGNIAKICYLQGETNQLKKTKKLLESLRRVNREDALAPSNN